MARSPKRKLLLLGWVGALLVVTGCDDDPSGPRNDLTPDDIWNPVSFEVEGTELQSIDCEGDHCLATGYRLVSKRAEPFPSTQSIFYEWSKGGRWAPAELLQLPAESYFDVGLGSEGGAVAVGWGFDGSSPYGVLYDGRPSTPTSSTQTSLALLTVDGDDGFFVAGGASRGGGILSSQSPGSWSADSVPTTGTNDGGFWDVYVRGEVAVACGYDDGADTLAVVLRRTATTPWQHVNRDGLAFALSLQCIALDVDGTIYLGGIQQAGSPNARAFCSVRSPAGQWTQLELPEATVLGGINDICIADDGSLYLAGGGEVTETSTARILRVSGDRITDEITPFSGKIHQIAQAQDGTLFAVGGRVDTESMQTTVVLLERTP